jgi:hypothetical protein
VILSGADIVGVWEYAPGCNAIQTRLWSSGRKLATQVAEAAEATATFIRQQIGDVKLSATDPPERRNKRLSFCTSG